MLTNKNLFFLIIQAQIGIGILTLPYVLYNKVQQDAWISLLIAGALSQVVIVILVSLSKVSLKENLYELSSKLLGRFLGNALNICYVLYFITYSMLLLFLVSDVIITWILHRTPQWAIILLILLAASYIAKEHLLTISKSFLVFSLLFAFLIVTIFFVYVQDVHFGRLLPFASKEPLQIVSSSPQAFVSLIGFELILFIMPFIKKPAESLKVLSIANGFTLSLYLFLLITCIVYFSVDQFKLVNEPLLYMLRGLSFKYIERIDIIFLSFWIIPITTSLVTQLFTASLGVQNLFSIGRSKSVYIIVGVLFILGMLPINNFIKESLSSLMTYLNIIFIFFIPTLLLIIAKLKVYKG